MPFGERQAPAVFRTAPDPRGGLRGLFAAALVLATALFLAPLPAPPEPGGLPTDKLAHVVVLAALALLARRAWPARPPPAALFAALVAYAALVELAQAALPWRSADAWDLVAGAVGALAVFVARRGRPE